MVYKFTTITLPFIMGKNSIIQDSAIINITTPSPRAEQPAIATAM